MELVWLGLIGLAILLFITYDLFKTTLEARKDGPLTHFIVGAIQFASLWIHRKSNYRLHRMLELIGPTSVVVTLINWVFWIWFGWILIFVSDSNSVVEAATGKDAALIDKIYYVTYSYTTLGLGDFEPRPGFYKILSSLLSLMGLFSVTISATYLLGVQAAFVVGKNLSVTVWSLGATPLGILHRAWNGEDFGSLSDIIPVISQMIAATVRMEIV
jgi:hypothetical protein